MNAARLRSVFLILPPVMGLVIGILLKSPLRGLEALLLTFGWVEVLTAPLSGMLLRPGLHIVREANVPAFWMTYAVSCGLTLALTAIVVMAKLPS